MIEVVCICKWRFKVQDEHAGLSIKCPKCRRLVDVPIAPPALIADEEERPELGEQPAPAAFVATADVQALQASIERLVAVNRSINNRLAWVVGLVTLILIRVLLRG
ncbi:hypothetical protein SAMN05444166_8144 [Singulisphaera sp. GP187]|uniref:hypothetical protein n=1 Tax=Singulisphaera sp. GP187 TaxID=1882752 RepID=UPI00092B12ED|nr:hypothetical protein [Singulisphaera sp. GP187]SIO66595.1 hypothetical protein SAMN05444166_8144 [Singulisphaera sp. GP187]